MRKSFESLAVLGKYLKQTEVRELALRQCVEFKLTNATFYRWIDSYNTRVHYRHQYFKATQHWRIGRQQALFDKLKAFTITQRANKFKFRNFFLVKCITEIMKRGVPRELYRNETDSYGDELKRLIDLRRLKFVDENEINQTIYLYDMQVKAAIFQQLKNDYERISTFKAN